MSISWSCGVSSHPSRAQDLLPRTLNSLSGGGFIDPVVRVDTSRLGAFGNFVLLVWEVYVRHPSADFYALFQDDLVSYRNLRTYLEATLPRLPATDYFNCYTWPCNVRGQSGWSLSDQWGRGAVALVFPNPALRFLLGAGPLIERPRNTQFGTKGVDRAVMESFKEDGRREWVHVPSLVQHTGVISTAGNKLSCSESPVFNGEDFDAMELLRLCPQTSS